MFRVILTHLYVIFMAIFVVMTGNILASRYGDDIVGSIKSLINSADSEMSEMQDSVKDWNKKVLD